MFYIIIRLKARLRPNIGFTLRGNLAVFTRSAINSAESEPILVKSGALWVHCWGGALDRADSGRELRSSDSLARGLNAKRLVSTAASGRGQYFGLCQRRGQSNVEAGGHGSKQGQGQNFFESISASMRGQTSARSRCFVVNASISASMEARISRPMTFKSRGRDQYFGLRRG